LGALPAGFAVALKRFIEVLAFVDQNPFGSVGELWLIPTSARA
jgi:hypothetical protein